MNTKVKAVFRPEAEFTLFLRTRTKNRPKIAKCISTGELFPCYRKLWLLKQTARSDFWPAAPK